MTNFKSSSLIIFADKVFVPVLVLECQVLVLILVLESQSLLKSLFC